MLRGDGDWARHELGDVVAPHELTVEVGIAAGQLEGFGATTILVDVGKEGTGVVTIVATRTEHYPAAIAAPRVITLGIGRIECAGGRCMIGTKVEHPEVGIAMPNMEHTILSKCEHQETPIRRYAGQSGALVHSSSIEHQFARGKLTRLRVETLAVDVVLDGVRADDELGAAIAQRVGVLEVGAAVMIPKMK